MLPSSQCPDLGQRPGQLRDHDVLEGGAALVRVGLDDLEHRLRERARETEVSGTRHQHGFFDLVQMRAPVPEDDDVVEREDPRGTRSLPVSKNQLNVIQWSIN